MSRNPLVPHLKNAQQVLLVPDGALALVSFAALPADETRYVVEQGRVIHYLTAERDIVAGEAIPAASGLLAVGAPAFDDKHVFASLTSARITSAAQVRAPLADEKTYRGNSSSAWHLNRCALPHSPIRS